MKFNKPVKLLLGSALIVSLIVLTSNQEVLAYSTANADERLAPSNPHMVEPMWWTDAGAAAAGGAAAGAVSGAAAGAGGLSWSLPGTAAGAGAGAVTGGAVGAVAGFVGYAATSGFNAVFGSSSEQLESNQVDEAVFNH